jgi:iron(III) transport system substrate-binding protein
MWPPSTRNSATSAPIEYFRKLKANDVKVVDGNSVVRDMVARGDVLVGLTDTDDVNVALEAKQPVAMVVPDREGMGVPVMPNMVSLVAGRRIRRKANG